MSRPRSIRPSSSCNLPFKICPFLMLLECRNHTFCFPRRPLVMGIVNLNDDSFSGDGTLDVAAALKQAEEMLRDGADMIDIGAESARTNRGPITVEQEVSRLLPFIERWHDLMAR